MSIFVFLMWFTYPSQKVNNLHSRNNSLNNYGNDLMREIMITFLAHLNNEII